MLDKLKQDLLVEHNVVQLSEQLNKSLISWFGIDCKSFSRARDRPIKGLPKWRQPPRLRSDQYPEGFHNLTGSPLEKVQKGNQLARTTARLIRDIIAKNKFFAVENPFRSYL